ncbi:MAG: aldo/keto reductase [Litorimonas sp.]
MTSPTPTTFTFRDGRTVNRLGFGTMRLTGQPGNFGPFPDWEAGMDVLRAARDAGVQHFDTARAYGPRHAEQIVRDALHPHDGLFVATKGGITKTGAGMEFIRRDARPEQLRLEVEQSLSDLGVDRIDLYYLHAPDREVSFMDQVGALVEAKARGEIARIGLSNVTLDQLDQALSESWIDAVQVRYNPRDGGDEALLDATTDRGIAFVPWGPLAAAPMRAGSPLEELEARDGLSPIQTALVQLLDRAPNILPIPGTTSAAHAVENAPETVAAALASAGL